jgi:glycosyltransferase involved in cell wall biosynthesis
LNICYLADGQSVHAQKWVKYFASKSHDVHLLTFHKTGSIDGVTVHNLRYFPKIAYPLRIIEVRRAIKKIKPDVLHAHYISHYGIYGALTGFSPFVVSAWGSDVLIDPKKSKTKKYFVKHALKKADLITCDAVHMIDAMKKLGAAPEKVNIINYGVDTRKFMPGKRNETLQATLGIHDSPAVISSRNLDPLYDVESLIRSIPLVLAEVPETKFVIAGVGSEETRLKELAKVLGIWENTRFVGFVLNDKLPQYLTSMDIYVSTALSDAGLSASTAEAMACGLPVIITDVAANKEWVNDGVNGFVVPTKNPELLAQKVIYLLKNDAERKRFGKTNRKIIETRNDYIKEMEKMENLYGELVERHKKGRH